MIQTDPGPPPLSKYKEESVDDPVSRLPLFGFFGPVHSPFTFHHAPVVDPSCNVSFYFNIIPSSFVDYFCFLHRELCLRLSAFSAGLRVMGKTRMPLMKLTFDDMLPAPMKVTRHWTQALVENLAWPSFSYRQLQQTISA